MSLVPTLADFCDLAPISIPGSGRSPGEGNGYRLQDSPGNSMDRAAWQVTIKSMQ